MTTVEVELNRLLALIAERLDLEHCQKVDERYRRALSCKEVDQVPLVIQSTLDSSMTMPAPWDGFQHYDYRTIFDSPPAMMQNMLLERVVPGVVLKDDSPLALRNDHGNLLAATALGAEWQQHQDDHPWAKPLKVEALEELAGSLPELDISQGVLGNTRQTLQFYRHKLGEYPPCDEAIQISMPDLQGPFDTAEQLWGADIYLSFYDRPELLQQLQAQIAEATVALAEAFRPYAVDRLGPLATTQHGYQIPGQIMIRNDSAIMLSADIYAEYVREYDAQVLEAIGGGTIHFCGDGGHLVPPMLEIADMHGLDLGQSYLVSELDEIYAQCRTRQVSVVNIRSERADLISGAAQRDFPTGAVIVYLAEDLEDAREVIRCYQQQPMG